MPRKTVNKTHLPFKRYLSAWIDPLRWVVDPSAKTVLDLGCGQGQAMLYIKTRIKPEYCVGVEIFKSYIQISKAQNIHNKYIHSDMRDVSFPAKSFDVVMAAQVIEHVPKQDAWKLVKNMEKFAKKQVIISTPIGECYQPGYGGNKWEEHKSFFYPEEFKKKGYKTIRYGWRWLLDEHSVGLIHKTSNPLFKKSLYVFNILMTPVYYLFQNTCDYSFVAFKDVSKISN